MLRPEGITVTLWNKEQIGTDPLGMPLYEETPVEIENVLVAPSSSDEVLDSTNMYGKKAVYTLAIPKTDNHDWTDKKVSFFGQDWKTFGIPLRGIDKLIPGAWNMKVTVERYE